MRLIIRLETPAEVTNQLETRSHQLETGGHPSKKKLMARPRPAPQCLHPYITLPAL